MCGQVGRVGVSTPPPPHPTIKRQNKKGKTEKCHWKTGRLLSHCCHCDGAPQAERGVGGLGGLGGSGGWDGTLSLLFLVISSACGER